MKSHISKIKRRIKSREAKALVGYAIGMLLGICLTACEDFVSVPSPETILAGEEVFKDDATALSTLADVYNNMNKTSDFASGGRESISFYQGLTSDELTLFSTNSDLTLWYLNQLNSESSGVSALWGNCYHIIYNTNEIISGTQNSTFLSPIVKSQLEGEAKFIRAFCHFYLVNIFGDIPYIRTTDYRANSVVTRTPTSQVYEFIVDDLLDAQELLTDDYPSDGRVRPNKTAVTALLARVYLYMSDWVNAELQATAVINNSNYNLMPPDQTFLIESNEAIWQLAPIVSSNNSYDAETFIVSGTPQWAIMSDELFDAFEAGDARKVSWVGTYSDGTNSYNFPYKYKKLPSETGSEYSIILRLAEQFLIRSEARTLQNKLTEAIADLDIIRSRAELPLIADTDPTIEKGDLLLAIEQERRVELFSEWGHRWFDLKRTDRSNEILRVVKPSWDGYDTLSPIPLGELLKNKNLNPQNFGY